MRILVVASEAVPFCKTGGLADVVGALARKMGQAGNDVCLVLPKYRAASGTLDASRGRSLRVALGGGAREVGWRFLRHQGIAVHFIDYPAYFDREGLYGEGGADYEDNDQRFALFSLAALESARAAGFAPDVIHAHDWQTGLVCAHLKRRYARDPFFSRGGSVFTVHNMAYQGLYPRAALEAAGFGSEDWTSDGLEFYGKVSYLKAGLAYADRLTTVSPTYAREIQEPERGFGFEGLLRRRSGVLRGVLNGLDLEAWDPGRDAAIPRRYGVSDAAAGKAACKEALQREFGLEIRGDQPLIGVVSRLDRQKGLDLALPAVEERLDRAQFFLVGTGDAALSKSLAALARRGPGRVHFHCRFDEAVSRRVYAACDLFLMPSRFEPCGLGQIIAMRYGAVPLAARTGGLADTVFEKDSRGRSANGFLCAPDDSEDLARALDRALDAWRGPSWAARVRAGMAADFSWDRSAAEYLEIFRGITASEKAPGAARPGLAP